MTENKPINTCEFFDICVTDCSGTLEDTEMCSCYELYKQLARKMKECEILQQSENEAKEIIAELKAENKQLKKQIKSDKGLITNAGKQNYQLVQEYDRLKTENEELKANSAEWKTFNRSFDNGIAKTQISDMSLAEYSQVKLERDKAEQKLQRIREIFDLIGKNYVWYNGKKAYIGDDLIEFLKTSVMQIIDEVE